MSWGQHLKGERHTYTPSKKKKGYRLSFGHVSDMTWKSAWTTYAKTTPRKTVENPSWSTGRWRTQERSWFCCSQLQPAWQPESTLLSLTFCCLPSTPYLLWGYLEQAVSLCTAPGRVIMISRLYHNINSETPVGFKVHISHQLLKN